MALMRGKLFAGALFAGKLFGTVVAAVERVAGGVSRRRHHKYLLEADGETLFFDTIEEIREFLQQHAEQAKQNLQTLPQKVVVKSGKPVVKAKPEIVKTNDADIQALVAEYNRIIQAQYERARQLLINAIMRRMDDEEAILLAIG